MAPTGTRRKTRRDEESDIEEDAATQQHADDIEPVRVKAEKVKKEKMRETKKEKSEPKKEKKPVINRDDDEDDDDAQAAEDERIDVAGLTDQPLSKADKTKLQGVMSDWTNIERVMGQSFKPIIEIVPHLVEFTEGDDKDKVKLCVLVCTRLDLVF